MTPLTRSPGFAQYDLFILALQAITVGTWSLYLFDSHRATFDVNEEHYVDMFDVSSRGWRGPSFSIVDV